MYKVLTRLQADVLESLFRKGIGDLGFFLTGGTALSEFYLQHRYSDDLDFFTRGSFPITKRIETFSEILASQGFDVASEQASDEYVRFFVSYREGEAGQLKVEFARDVPAMMSPPLRSGEIVVDSFEDIAANKICAILNREPPEPKDYVDLHFILRMSNFTLDYLLNRAREKDGTLDNEFGILQFATNLARVKDLHFMPRMIKPISLDTLKTGIAPLAYEIINRFRPNAA